MAGDDAEGLSHLGPSGTRSHIPGVASPSLCSTHSHTHCTRISISVTISLGQIAFNSPLAGLWCPIYSSELSCLV